MSHLRVLMQRPGRILIPIALFLLAVAVRTLSWRLVVLKNGIAPRGNDPFYHLRRIVYSVANFPATLEFDSYINYPDGARPIWTPLFDWTLALLVRPFVKGLAAGQISDLQTVQRIAIWVPPVLGGLCVLLLYWMARRRFGSAIALTSALILSVLNGHIWYSQIGFIDHHVMVGLVSLIALIATMGLLERDSRGQLGPAWGASLGVGSAFAVAILTWPGTLLHVGLLESGLLVYLVTRSKRDCAIGFALRFACANATALLLVLPFTLNQQWQQWSPFSPLVLSEFQPWFFGGLGCFGVVYCAVWRGDEGGRIRRWATALIVGIALTAASAVLFSGLKPGIEDSFAWLARTETFQSQVLESFPILSGDKGLTLFNALTFLSGFILLFPVAVLVVAVKTIRHERHGAALLVFLWYAVGLFGATLAQRRFFNSLSIPVALMMGWSLHAAYRAIPARFLQGWAQRGAARALFVVIALLLLKPTLASYTMHVRNEIRAWRGEPIEVTRQNMRHQRALQVARWFRKFTPPTKGWLDVSLEPEYAILGPWSIGHMVEFVGRRPTVTNAFGDDIGKRNFDLARLYFEVSESKATEILDQLGVRYVISGPSTVFLDNIPRPKSMFRALHRFGGSLTPPPQVERRPVEPLENHRLVFESFGWSPADSEEPPVFKIFEYVPGAVLSGRAAPGVKVHASLRLVTNRDRRIRYENSGRASADGRYEIRVPYSNIGYPKSLDIEESYTLECNKEIAKISVRESAILNGRTVKAPDLCTEVVMENHSDGFAQVGDSPRYVDPGSRFGEWVMRKIRR